MFTVSVAFLGEYRPLHFSADTLAAAVAQARAATATAQDAQRIGAWLDSCANDIMRPNRMSVSHEHDRLSVSIRRAPHDPWLDAITFKLPPLPGADYSAVLNQ